jgi:hypothetical protein
MNPFNTSKIDYKEYPATKELRIEFRSQNNQNNLRLNEEDYRQLLALLRQSYQGWSAVITGRGNGIAYAGTAFYLVHAGIQTIRYQKVKENPILIFDRGAAPEPKPWCKTTADRVELLPAPTPDQKWDEETKKQLCRMPALPPPTDKSPLLLTGKGPVFFYATLGASAAFHQWPCIQVSLPDNPDIIFSLKDIQLCEARFIPGKGVVLGILGDPNSGKSLFSNILQNCLITSLPRRKIWRYDCDQASPSPEWVAELESSNDTASQNYARAARDASKVQWTPDREETVRHFLEHDRSRFDLLVADMPGGKHCEEKNIHERIPAPSRADMMAPCDAFIVLCRKDKPGVFEGWRKALGKYSLADRIIAKIFTDAPDASLTVSPMRRDESGLFTCTIQGLNRRKTTAQMTLAMTDALSDFCHFLADLPRHHDAQPLPTP